MKIVLIAFLALGCFACSGTNGDDVPTQEELRKELKQLMKPDPVEEIVSKPDTTFSDTAFVLDSIPE